MARSNAVYKETYNKCLGIIREIGVEGTLPPELEIAERLTTSRTTVRAVLERLDAEGLIEWEGRRKTIRRLPRTADFFERSETRPPVEKVETAFMEYVLGGDLAPGTILRESELAREFGTGASVVHEFMIDFSRSGLIEKKPNRHWVLRGFTRDYAIELFDVREMFERRAFDRFATLGPGAGAHAALLSLKPEHLALCAEIGQQYLRFPRLDDRFHRVFLDVLDNRFVDDFFQIVRMIFHFHYRWNKVDEIERNLSAAQEHLAVIEAVEAGRMDAAAAAFDAHLASARRTLLDSVQWGPGERESGDGQPEPKGRRG